MATKFKAQLVKDGSSFYLVGPGFLKVEVTGSMEDAWQKLEQQYEANAQFYQRHGLLDELNPFNLKKAFEKNFFLENLIKGLILMVPILIGFALFSFMITNQMGKLAGKIKEAVNPYDEKAIRSEEGFKRTLERYRPYIHHTLTVWEEEKKKVESKRD